MIRLYACPAPVDPSCWTCPQSALESERNQASNISSLLHPFHFHFLALHPRLQDDFLASFRQSIRCCHSASDQLISSTDHIHLSLIITRETLVTPVSHLSRGSETLQALWICLSFWSVDCCMNELDVRTRPIHYLTLSALSPHSVDPITPTQA